MNLARGLIVALFRAGRNWGWLLSLAAASLAVFLVIGADKSGLDTAINDSIVQPAAQSVGLAREQCPSGWKDVSATDLHVRVLSCERVVAGTRWLVILNPDGTFSYGVPVDMPGALIIRDETLVPGW